MSQKYSSTTADYMEWSEAMNLIRKLAKDKNYKISLLIAIGCFTGLRISDILALKWEQILDVSEFTIREKKTGKLRRLRINPELQTHIHDCYTHISNTSTFLVLLERVWVSTGQVFRRRTE